MGKLLCRGQEGKQGKRKQQPLAMATVLPKVHDTVPVSQDEDKDNKASEGLVQGCP